MRTLYTMTPFRKEDFSRMGDVIDEAEALIAPLLKDLDDVIAKLPVEKVGPFKTRRDQCLAESSVKKYMCLNTLYQDMKKALEDPGGAAPPVVPPAPRSEFPWLWVGLGGAAVVGLVTVLALAARK